MPINLAEAHLTQIKKPSKIQSLRYRMETKSVRSNGSKEALEKKVSYKSSTYSILS